MGEFFVVNFGAGQLSQYVSGLSREQLQQDGVGNWEVGLPVIATYGAYQSAGGIDGLRGRQFKLDSRQIDWDRRHIDRYFRIRIKRLPLERLPPNPDLSITRPFSDFLPPRSEQALQARLNPHDILNKSHLKLLSQIISTMPLETRQAIARRVRWFEYPADLSRGIGGEFHPAYGLARTRQFYSPRHFISVSLHETAHGFDPDLYHYLNLRNNRINYYGRHNIADCRADGLGYYILYPQTFRSLRPGNGVPWPQVYDFYRDFVFRGKKYHPTQARDINGLIDGTEYIQEQQLRSFWRLYENRVGPRTARPLIQQWEGVLSYLRNWERTLPPTDGTQHIVE
jgi:hypothetical protein